MIQKDKMSPHILVSLISIMSLFALNYFWSLNPEQILVHPNIADTIDKVIELTKSKAPFVITLLISIPVIFCLEAIVPAEANKSLNHCLYFDLVWLFFTKLFQITILLWFIDVIKSIYQDSFSYLSIEGIGSLPTLVQIVIILLLVDFLAWFHHFLRHKIDFFWQFHQLHHSQRNMNIFTNYRVHFMDALMAAPIITIPLLMLSVDTPEIAIIVVIRLFSGLFEHANIKTNLGIFRYILVTPQSHRVHHSIEPEHQDCNYGVIFSIWDHMFGTQHRNYDSYPDTGIENNRFPIEERGKKQNLFVLMIKQLIFPFFSFFRSNGL